MACLGFGTEILTDYSATKVTLKLQIKCERVSVRVEQAGGLYILQSTLP